jgi:SWI/SNF-related matrix-associated actin-dependent regulator 1 of chromatin subfamily A
MEALIDLLTNGDLAGEKVIIFSRFKKMINLLMPALRKAKLHPVRVTGDESGPQRQAAQDAFQDPDGETKVICITMAGGDAINLQAAKAIVFFDTPWSAGDYIQIIGRMIRIGSLHSNVLALHLVARSKKEGKTIDHRVMDVIGSKMKLIEAVLGERLKGTEKGPDKAPTISVSSDINDIFDALRADAEARS